TRAMVRMRLTSSTTMTMTRKAGNRGGCSVVISGHSFRAVPCAGSPSRRKRPCLRRRQFFVDGKNARQPAEREYRRCGNAECDTDLAEWREVGFQMACAQADHGHV